MDFYELFVQLRYYDGSVSVRKFRQGLESNEAFPARVHWNVNQENKGYSGDVRVSFPDGTPMPASVSIGVALRDWRRENYLLMPGAVYNGNRFFCADVKYPPFIPEELREKARDTTIISDVPRLSDRESRSQIQLLSGDMTRPAICAYAPEQKIGYIFQGPHKVDGNYTGFTVCEDLETGTAEFTISAPGVREKEYYRMTDTHVPSDDAGRLFQAGESVTIPFTLDVFSCESVSGLFKTLFETPYKWANLQRPACVTPFTEAFGAVTNRFEEAYYDETDRFYGLGLRKGKRGQFWQIGWVGGGMSGYPILKKGSGIQKKHTLETLEFIFRKTQNENGWLAPMYQDGEFYGDTLKFFTGETETEDEKQILLVRKNADALYFILRQLLLLREQDGTDKLFLDGTHRLCDAFVRLWNKHGRLGQFLRMDTEEIVIDGTASASAAPAALALAEQVFPGESYLKTAEEIGEYYCENYLEKGLMNGGPGEILQCPDSESSFALLESCVELALATGKDSWVKRTEEAAHHAATWVMQYDFDFPEHSTDKKFGMRTAGTVFANAQNKHSAPGICTLSGVSLLKLYRLTGNTAYLTLCEHISNAILQFVQTKDRKIPTIMDKNPTPGCVCERVQTSDWEGKSDVGEILAPTSGWPETSVLLTCTELPSVYWNTADDQLAVFDHLEAAVLPHQDGLELWNPTAYDLEGEIWLDTKQTQSCEKVCFSLKKGENIKILRAEEKKEGLG